MDWYDGDMSEIDMITIKWVCPKSWSELLGHVFLAELFP